MPTYEYACTSCGRRLEVVQSFQDAPLEDCERCGGRLRRVFHPAGVMFKGSGFYSTDSRGGKSRAPDREAKKPATGGNDKPKTDKAATPAASASAPAKKD